MTLSLTNISTRAPSLTLHPSRLHLHHGLNVKKPETMKVIPPPPLIVQIAMCSPRQIIYIKKYTSLGVLRRRWWSASDAKKKDEDGEKEDKQIESISLGEGERVKNWIFHNSSSDINTSASQRRLTASADGNVYLIKNSKLRYIWIDVYILISLIHRLPMLPFLLRACWCATAEAEKTNGWVSCGCNGRSEV